jgi:hypothetical protein
MTYPDAADLAQWIPAADPDDPNVVWCIEAAASAIERACGRTFTITDPEQRTYQAEYHRGGTLVDIDDVTTTDDLVIVVDGNEVSDYTLLPRNAAQKNRPWAQVELTGAVHGWVGVTAQWGWDAPPAIRLATAIQAGRFLDRQNSVAGPLTDYRVDDVEQQWTATGRQDLDPDVLASIAAYRRLWGAA